MTTFQTIIAIAAIVGSVMSILISVAAISLIVRATLTWNDEV